MRYFWALLLFVVGLAFLGVEFGIWGHDSINELWQFWPLIFIFGGVSLLVRGLKYASILMMVLFTASLLLIYGVVFTDYGFGSLKKEIEREVKRNEINVLGEEEIDSQEVTVKTGAIKFNISGSTEELVSGYLDSDILDSRVTTNYKNRIAKSEIYTEGTRSFWLSGFSSKNHLDLSFNKLVPLSLKIHAVASDLKLDLTNYQMKNLSIDAGASNIEIKLGEVTEKDFIINAKTGVSSIRIKIPADYNVIINTESTLSNVRVPDNLGNPKATVKINMNSALSSVEVERF